MNRGFHSYIRLDFWFLAHAFRFSAGRQCFCLNVTYCCEQRSNRHWRVLFVRDWETCYMISVLMLVKQRFHQHLTCIWASSYICKWFLMNRYQNCSNLKVSTWNDYWALHDAFSTPDTQKSNMVNKFYFLSIEFIAQIFYLLLAFHLSHFFKFNYPNLLWIFSLKC